MSKKTRVGIIGAGYISDWHADAIKATDRAELTCVVDSNPAAAQEFAARRGIAAFGSVQEMLAAGAADAVHVLTPPEYHRAVCEECVAGGLHVLVEKPVALSASDVTAMVSAAEGAGVQFAAGHNFLALPSYQRLKALKESGKLGRVSTAEISWCFPLGPLRSGPYGIWMMRKTGNLLQELGPHLYAFMQDLFGDIEVLHLQTSNEIALPGGGTRPQGWQILARAGGVDVTLNLALVETFDDRSVVVRGSSAMARLDYAKDSLVVSGVNTSDLVLNPLRDALGQSLGHLREGAVNAARQLTSLNQKSPYGLSFRGICDAVYSALAEGRPVDARFSGASAIKVMRAIDETLALLPEQPVTTKPEGIPQPTALVIGGTGFIGRALTRRLAQGGTHVRVLSRGKTGPFDDIADKVETVAVSLRDAQGLEAAMQGITHVYHLAKSEDKTWAAALENDVAVTERIAQAALNAGVKRLIYTGTIASYDLSDPQVTITEASGFGEDMESRNIYARSKAECEARLMAMHRDKGLPVTIARPGIVVGAGGPLQHWGIGRWHGAGAVKIWGSGENILPFVLIDDVADGLILMARHEAALGESFNLIGEPMLSARGYFDAIHQALGARIKVSSGPLGLLYATDAVKFFLKTKVLRRGGLSKPSLRDWKSRAHYSPFDNSKPKAKLGWTPEGRKDAFIKAAITDAGLLGF
ncbi:NAD-dependent epimerase/dehydratase family protein [Sulfitobacter sp. M57]|uniref:NAD-dependent epimerase/dehydratase family protein n=1 Tax=unclassified Sulfitobacter TaxID=196795 RepID=UPI0023E208D5|nr:MULTISPECIES: NAD-dependent epimerase/dehydratase family protein [unclassified Sulfitobacter]MDF3416614.1 NAD-dependent epimerase/dehydratase family protein [Sulfitobacter sp. KE5]MDF3424094.1 NAD-dependent epimerase/dehydratase family protein [Sulfitobacter sp. KE43]MDF3435159.1 NAD-dependent epimerase/dehydratase family protein [Sulfitobacter sp. KE42]MDF3460799.1 NAD-dependent epimerase/dehydratase family protein [Sulfitobacter sp. S74]MDF3464696.1 NAD-dependent epimerase/dehydratase fam